MNRQNEEIVTRLQMYRMQLQEEMQPEDWTEATCPIIATLSDVCDALCLSEGERSQVLGWHNVVLLDLSYPITLVPASVAEVV